MNIILQDRDALQLMAAQLTREQAGLRLAGVCKDWWKFVRAADAAALAGAAEFWLAVPPTWSLERVLPRIDRFCTASMWWGFEEENRGLLNLFAGKIDMLREEGVVELVFDKTLARRGKKASIMGCHTLKVLDAFQFLSRMHGWVHDTQMTGQGYSELEGWDTPSDAILDLLGRLGLKRRRVTRKQPRRMVWFPADKRLAKNEPLWHRAYVA